MLEKNFFESLYKFAATVKIQCNRNQRKNIPKHSRIILQIYNPNTMQHISYNTYPTTHLQQKSRK